MKRKPRLNNPYKSELRDRIRKRLRRDHQYSDRFIAEIERTSHVTVAKVRRENNAWANYATTGRDGVVRTRPTRLNTIDQELKAASARLTKAVNVAQAMVAAGADRPESAKIKSQIKTLASRLNDRFTALLDS
jgi:membrane-associated HD superfamily phosphohydrolase